MRKLIGGFFLGHETVNVFVDTKMLGAKAQTPGDWVHGGKTVTEYIVVGIGEDRWSTAMENLLHEAFEYVAAKRNVRYEADLGVSEDSSNCLFVFNHCDYTQMIAAVAELVGQCQAAILEEHKKLHAPKPKRRKKK